MSVAKDYPQFARVVPSDGAIAESMAQFVAEAFGWRNMNVVIGSDGIFFMCYFLPFCRCAHLTRLESLAICCTGYSYDGAQAFMHVARKYNITIVSTQVYKHKSKDMSETIRGLKASKCRGVVLFSTTIDMVELLLESKAQNLGAVWITGDSISSEYSKALRIIAERVPRHERPEVFRGMFVVTLRHGRGLPRYNQFIQDWYVKS